jgi:glycosyltransferase involved in cell wall biosynthesis
VRPPVLRATAVAAVGAFSVDRVARARAEHERRAATERLRASAVAATLDAPATDGTAGAVLVVVPALDEAESLGPVLASLPHSVAGLPLRVLVVDDGSSDDTGSVARRAGAVVVTHPRNLGQGDALRSGFDVARCLHPAVVVTMDADGQHDPGQLAELVGPVVRGEADYVQGSRFLGTYQDAGGARHAGIKGFTLMVNLVGGTRITDCTNGYRAIRGDAMERLRLREDRFSAAEILIEAAAAGLRILEVPVHIASRTAGESRKPRGLGYPLGFLGVVLRSGARVRTEPLRQRVQAAVRP